MNLLFLHHNARSTIDWLQFVKAHDPDGLVKKHFIYACDTLLLLLSHIFNGATCEVHTIVPIFKN